MSQEELFMKEALKEAKKAEEIDEVPIGAIIVYKDEIIARAFNKRESTQNALTHAEIQTINEACQKLKSWRLIDCDMYVTFEPCMMCTGAIIQSRIRNVYYGASDHKNGGIITTMQSFDKKAFNHSPNVIGGILEEECSQILKNYFRKKR